MAYPGWGTGPIERTVPIGPRSDHYIVCGANALAHRLVVELTEQYDVPVVAIVADRDRDHAPQIVQILGDASVISAPVISEATLLTAEIGTARGIALVAGDDQSNIHTALRAQERNRDVRIVLRIYNQRLGGQIQQLFPNCAALSGSATAAPAFVNAALRRPNSVQVGGRSISVAFGQEARPVDFLCTIADRIDQQDLARMRLLPDAPGPTARWIEEVSRNPTPQLGGRAVLQFLDSEPKLSVPRLNRLRWRLVDMIRFFTGVQLRLVLFGSVVTVAGCFALMWALNRPFAWAVYQTLLDLAGSAVPDTYGAANRQGTGGSWQRLAQVAITLCGIPLMAVVTAVLVENTGRGRHGALKSPSAGIRDHVVVVGLGNVGSRIATHLHRIGVPVVCIERDPTARGIGVARSLDIPVLVGEGALDRMLDAARIQTARALLAVTGDDATNLEAALEARAIQPEVRIVMRLFDDDFAAHVYRTFKNAASRSVSYLAAPGFAAALMGREVLGTLSVYRRVVLIAQFEVKEGSRLKGRPLRDIELDGELRVIALLPKGSTTHVWRPDHARKLVVGDLYVVLATGLGVGRHTAAIF
jgi:Trk K+ transport system NAD-binding subunit